MPSVDHAAVLLQAHIGQALNIELASLPGAGELKGKAHAPGGLTGCARRPPQKWRYAA